ncbi:hypothetical protein CDD83_5663 [Cordyceps sp. RAO-2017]|nr:hypothetical protein CDD83_5663 [Cordyceps sp. RAO-2017]
MPSAEIEPSQLVEVEMVGDDDDDDDAAAAQDKNALRISTLPRSESNLLRDNKQAHATVSKVNGKQPVVVDSVMKTIEI